MVVAVLCFFVVGMLSSQPEERCDGIGALRQDVTPSCHLPIIRTCKIFLLLVFFILLLDRESLDPLAVARVL